MVMKLYKGFFIVSRIPKKGDLDGSLHCRRSISAPREIKFYASINSFLLDTGPTRIGAFGAH